MVQGGNESLLRGINFAALVMEGFDAESLLALEHALEEAGAMVHIVSANQGTITGTGQNQTKNSINVQATFVEAGPQEFAAVVIPGGKAHAEQLRRHPAAQGFIQAFVRDGKPVATHGHGIALLADSGLLRNQTVTSPPELKNDVVQAEGNWIDQALVTHGWLISSSSTDDPAEFIQATLTLTANHVAKSVSGTRDEKTIIGPGS